MDKNKVATEIESAKAAEPSPAQEPASEPRPRLDLDQVRAKLSGQNGPTYWRSLEEVAETPEFNNWLEDEFPNRSSLLSIDRRSLLKFMGASMALAGLSGCRSVFLDEEKIVPYVKQPEEMVPGEPLFFATAAPHFGRGVGIIVESRDGRPIKIEGNPEHPESKGATNAALQSEILNFYDPDRSQAVRALGEISTWDVFFSEVRKVLGKQKAKQGAGIRILIEPVLSPTLAAQLKDFQAAYPRAKWYQYDPIGSDGAKEASQAAFGGQLSTIYDISKAKVIVSLDANFLMDGPGSLRYARDFANGRRVMGDNTDMNRLYVFESHPSVTGATADHRFRVRASAVESVAAALATALGVPGLQSGQIPGIKQENIAAIARDLQANRGAAVVIPGEGQTTAVHMLCHMINDAIGATGATATHVPSNDESPITNVAALKELAADLNSKSVDLLLMIGTNPVYTAPADINFADALKNCPMSVHHGIYNDETGMVSNWHIPQSHFLEQWSDVRGYDGTVSIVQPLIAPLFESKSNHQLISMLMGKGDDGYEIIKSHYRPALQTSSTGLSFDKQWNRWLNDGVIPNTKHAPVLTQFKFGDAMNIQVRPPVSGMELVVKPDPTIFDGRYSNNGWQQELAKPISKATWENTITLSPATAQVLDLVSEDGVELTANGRTITGAVSVQPGHADESVTVHLGYGRTHGGAVANGIGFNAYNLRSSTAMSVGTADVKKIGDGSHPVASTQLHHSMEGRDIVRLGSIEDYKKNPTLHEHKAELPLNPTRPGLGIEGNSLYPDEILNYNGPQWGMTVDLNTCIGCNACVTACQAENNIPVVGKAQVKRGREMQWIRIDSYYSNTTRNWDAGNFGPDPIADPDFVFQPMMCQHCEKAPCEPVCPVGATMHSHEGLNQMVYNRCVGTRYCSNNCPYKVRRFNYLNFSDNQTQFDAKDEENRMRVPLLKLLNNPDVTVRGRGVMEKCTFCVQRINDVRIEAKKLGRDPLDGEIKTACQQACPTKTIVFGNVADEKSEVSKIRNDKRSYQVLRELQTRPRVSYLGKIRNTNPEITA